MAREQLEALGLWQVAADAGGQHGFLDQAGDVFVRQSITGRFAIITGDALEQRPKVDPGIVQILFKRMHRAGLIAGASADFNLAPAGFATKRQDQTRIFDFNPAITLVGVVAVDIKADYFRTAQTLLRSRSAE